MADLPRRCFSVRGRSTAVFGGLFAIVFIALSGLESASAAYSNTSSSAANALTALTVLPPTAASATLGLNVLPALTCHASLTWTASTTSGVTAYEVRRVRISDGAVMAGPWTVVAPAITSSEAVFPIVLIAQGFIWQVRAIRSTWTSTWASSTTTNPLLCLL